MYLSSCLERLDKKGGYNPVNHSAHFLRAGWPSVVGNRSLLSDSHYLIFFYLFLPILLYPVSHLCCVYLVLMQLQWLSGSSMKIVLWKRSLMIENLNAITQFCLETQRLQIIGCYFKENLCSLFKRVKEVVGLKLAQKRGWVTHFSLLRGATELTLSKAHNCSPGVNQASSTEATSLQTFNMCVQEKRLYSQINKPNTLHHNASSVALGVESQLTTTLNQTEISQLLPWPWNLFISRILVYLDQSQLYFVFNGN